MIRKFPEIPHVRRWNWHFLAGETDIMYWIGIAQKPREDSHSRIRRKKDYGYHAHRKSGQ